MVDLAGPAALRQRDSSVRFEWGLAGMSALTETAWSGGAVVVVDVLSFTTAVSVAVGRGMAIVPHRFGDPDVGRAAAGLGAEVAVPRGEVTAVRPWSLSPAALDGAPIAERLVLPSPNGSAIAAASPGLVLAACLRNRDATFRWLKGHGRGSTDRPLLVVAAGEQWPDGSLRPALEDALGAGALLSRFEERGYRLSVEASAAAALYAATDDRRDAIGGCASGLQLAGSGYGGDVEMAVELDVDDWAAVGDGGPFVRS